MTVGFSRDLEAIRRVALQARNSTCSDDPTTRALAAMIESLARATESALTELYRTSERAELDASRAKRMSMRGGF